MRNSLLILLLAWALTATGADRLSVGVFPRRDAQTTRQMFMPMMRYLQHRLGFVVDLDVPPDFQAFRERLREGRYDLVHLNQFQYLQAHQNSGYEAILKNEEAGRSDIAAVIWVRKDAGIETPMDLRGQRIVFGGDSTAMISYVMAVDLLKQHGLSESDYLGQFALNPMNAVINVYYRRGKAAGAGDGLIRLPWLSRQIDMDQLKPLLTSQPLAHLPWAVSPRIGREQAAQIRAVLSGLKKSRRGRRVLQSAGLSGLIPATDDEYDPHRQVILRTLGEHY